MGQLTLLTLLNGLGIFSSGNNIGVDMKVEMLIHGFIIDLLMDIDPWLDVETACGFPCSVVNCTKEEEEEVTNRRANKNKFSSFSSFPSSSMDLLKQAFELRANLPIKTDSQLDKPNLLEEYAGRYYDIGYDNLYLTWDGVELRFKFNEIVGKAMKIGENEEEEVLWVFPSNWYATLLPVLPLVFERDESNNIVSLSVPSFEPLVPPTFVKVA